jgi:nucleoside-diphosphate-sugar epimerase
MTGTMLIFGMGYTSGHLAERLRKAGWQVVGTRRAAGQGAIAFDDHDAVLAAIAKSSHILSSVPPIQAGGDPVIDLYGDVIAASEAEWVGYLSSTGVYGNTGGAWVDESGAIGIGRRTARADADQAWQRLRADVCVFRLPGIYGPGRSALDRVREGKAHRIDLPEQVFSRVHVDDIVSGVIASFRQRAGVYNLSDNLPCHQNAVIEYAAALLGLELPPMQSIDEAGLSPMARGFYAENRRISNGKAQRLLEWRPAYGDYRQGLEAILSAEKAEHI